MADEFIQKTFDRARSAGLRKRFSDRAIEWFSERVRTTKVFRGNKDRILKQDSLFIDSTPEPGKMYLFQYDAKTKEKLPYFDRIPLILLVNEAPNGFVGLNIHYLSPQVRAKFFSKLLELRNTKKRFDRRTHLQLSYDFLNGSSKYKEFAPTFKRYLFEYVKSPIKEVNSQHWEVVTWLPFEDFTANRRTVWADSKRKIKNR